MNLSEPKQRRPRASSFKSLDEFWDRVDSCPDQFHFLDATEMLAFAKEVSLAIQKREKNGSETASKNGRKREETGDFRGEDGGPATNGHAGPHENVGPGNPPKEHQFKKGNPGGPGRPGGGRSMRKLIRQVLFDEETQGKFSGAVVNALFQQAIKGNTHAIRIICENGNNRSRR